MIDKFSLFVCPICKSELTRCEGSLKCQSNHSFDIAKQGYVNLLLSNAQGKRHGDDKLMVMARRSFLDKGYYSILRDKIAEVLGEGHKVLDAGCGEGYYTSLFAKGNEVYGIDISKDALKSASVRCKDCSFAVASIADIPLPDSSVDGVVLIFAPDSRDEFLRVLKTGGRLITVTPMEKHLFELKEAVYDEPYLNPPTKAEREGFELLSANEVKYTIELDCNEDILALFKMTPYYYKTSKTDQQKLEKIDRLSTRLEFLIAEYEKI